MTFPIVNPSIIDLNSLENYANQVIPPYITKDNTPPENPITDKGATLGRVLFYDKKLSVNNSISCASCHQQEAAFSDTEPVSFGVNGTTTRHSPRLINLRFGEETKFFWDERAVTLEALIFEPIEDHIEMGFSGTNGQPSLDSLFNRLSAENYYQELFAFAFGDTEINQERIEKAIAQFMRSIQSFDSKYDEGRIAVANDSVPFTNFSTSENLGKKIFLEKPVFDDFGHRIAGGAGCAQCHNPPEFDIDPESGNNGIVGVFGSTNEKDFSITRVPTLRDLTDDSNTAFGGFMHNASMGEISKIYGVIAHYNSIPDVTDNPNIDKRLVPNGHPQQLHLTASESIGLAHFLKTLKGKDVFINPKWSNPFDENGNLNMIPLTTTSVDNTSKETILLYPNPVDTELSIQSDIDFDEVQIIANNGRLIQRKSINSNRPIDLSQLTAGLYFLVFKNHSTQQVYSQKIMVY